MIYLFLLVLLSTIVQIFYSAYALPIFKDAYPEEFKAAGSPSMIWVDDGTFHGYLMANRHKQLPDPFIVRILDRLKWICLFTYLGLAVFACGVVVSFLV